MSDEEKTLLEDVEDLLYADEEIVYDEDEDEEGNVVEDKFHAEVVGSINKKITTKDIATGKADTSSTIQYPFLLIDLDTAKEELLSYVKEIIEGLLLKEVRNEYMLMHVYLRQGGEVCEKGITDNRMLAVLLQDNILNNMNMYAKLNRQTKYEGTDLYALMPLALSILD